MKQICSPFSTASGTFGLRSFAKCQRGTGISSSRDDSIKMSANCLSLRVCQVCPPVLMQTRGVVNYSKKGKKKTVKAVAKRFHRTGSGKLKYWPAGKVHNMLSKSRNHRRSLCKPRYASKIQLKTLNKMIAGW